MVCFRVPCFILKISSPLVNSVFYFLFFVFPPFFSCLMIFTCVSLSHLMVLSRGFPALLYKQASSLRLCDVVSAWLCAYGKWFLKIFYKYVKNILPQAKCRSLIWRKYEAHSLTVIHPFPCAAYQTGVFLSLKYSQRFLL